MLRDYLLNLERKVTKRNKMENTKLYRIMSRDKNGDAFATLIRVGINDGYREAVSKFDRENKNLEWYGILEWSDKEQEVLTKAGL